jgi:hypothetical protein
VAERNPSKQRRQAQNRAMREARRARSEAANTPVTERRVSADDEPDEGRRSRRRSRKGQEEVRAQARSVIEAEAKRADDDEIAPDVDAADLGETGDDDLDDVVPSTDRVVTRRRGSSPVFSSRHRAAVAATTIGRAPARTHAGVAEATGTELVGPRTGSKTRSAAATSTPPRAGTSRAAATGGDRNTDTGRKRGDRSGSAGRSSSGSTAMPRKAYRPPARPLPPFFDRFGGNEPGGRWVMVSFATVLLASIVLNFVHVVPEVVENAKGHREQTGRTFTIWHFGVGPALYYLLPPIVILGLFILTARPWDRRRSWNFALALLTLSTFLTGLISIYVIPIACLAWGCWQARKAALEDVGGDPRVLREVERERRVAGKEALRARRDERRSTI